MNLNELNLIDNRILNRLLFVHIPKTGGISLHSQLQKVFSTAKSIRFGDRKSNEKFFYTKQEELRSFDYITGHQPLNTFRKKGIDYPAIILFRDPLSRIISTFKYINQSQHPDHINFNFKNFDEFIDWIVKDFANSSYFQSTEVSFIDKNDSSLPIQIESVSPVWELLYNLQTRFVAGTRYGATYAYESITAKQAIEFLDNDLVYPVPLEFYYDDLLATLSKVLNTELINVKKNVSNSQPIEIEAKQLRLLEPLIQEDQILFEILTNNYKNYKTNFLNKLFKLSI